MTPPPSFRFLPLFHSAGDKLLVGPKPFCLTSSAWAFKLDTILLFHPRCPWFWGAVWKEGGGLWGGFGGFGVRGGFFAGVGGFAGFGGGWWGGLLWVCFFFFSGGWLGVGSFFFCWFAISKLYPFKRGPTVPFRQPTLMRKH